MASPICSPSRVGITTGRFPSRHLIHSYLNNRERNRERGMRDFLDPAAPAIARAFHGAGYATAHFGKWHMGGGRDVGDAPPPQAYGFDESLVSFEGLGDRILPPGRLADQSAVLGRGSVTRVDKHRQTPIYIDRSIDFIRRNRAKPFYLHLWLNDVHDVHAPTAEQLAPFALLENPYVSKFYAVLTAMDREIGRLLDEIDGLGLAEETLIGLTSDNGPTAWPRYYNEGYTPRPAVRPGPRAQVELGEGGIRMPLIVRWKGRVAPRTLDDQTVLGAVDLFPTFCALAGIQLPDAAFDGEDTSAALLPRQRTNLWLWG